MKTPFKAITVSLGLSALLISTSAFGALQFTPPEILSSEGVVTGDGLAFKTKLVRMGNGMLVSVYGDSVPSQYDVYDLKSDSTSCHATRVRANFTSPS